MKVDVNTLKIKLLTQVEKLRHSKPTFQYALTALGIGFLVTFASPLYEFFSLSASSVLNIQAWKLLTCSFVEPNILVVIFHAVVAHQFFHSVQPVWGNAESLKYALIVQILTPFIITFLAVLRFAMFQSFHFYYYGNLNGFSPLAGALLVANKQYLPDTVLLPTPMGRIKNTHLPAISVACAFLLWIFGLVRGAVTLQLAIGTQIGWTYLRFYQAQHDSNEVGDHNEHFAWATLFPRRSQPLATVLGKIVFRTLARVGICKRNEYTGFEQFEPVDVVFPTAESRDADRRRQKALRDLNERLGRTKTAQSSSNVSQIADATPEVVVVSSPTEPNIQHSVSSSELKGDRGSNY